jgi:hypothetical protein
MSGSPTDSPPPEETKAPDVLLRVSTSVTFLDASDLRLDPLFNIPEDEDSSEARLARRMLLIEENRARALERSEIRSDERFNRLIENLTRAGRATPRPSSPSFGGGSSPILTASSPHAPASDPMATIPPHDPTSSTPSDPPPPISDPPRRDSY